MFRQRADRRRLGTQRMFSPPIWTLERSGGRRTSQLVAVDALAGGYEIIQAGRAGAQGLMPRRDPLPETAVVGADRAIAPDNPSNASSLLR